MPGWSTCLLRSTTKVRVLLIEALLPARVLLNSTAFILQICPLFLAWHLISTFFDILVRETVKGPEGSWRLNNLLSLEMWFAKIRAFAVLAGLFRRTHVLHKLEKSRTCFPRQFPIQNIALTDFLKRIKTYWNFTV